MLEIIKDKLYFACLQNSPKASSNTFYFTVDEVLVYERFYSDFGPLKLSQLYRYCRDLHARLETCASKGVKVVHYSGPDPEKRANAAFLIGAYQILYLKRSPVEAVQTLTGKGVRPFLCFRDAASNVATHRLTLLDCFSSLHKVLQLGLFSLEGFDLDEYEYYESVDNGDINWIVEKKLLAFCGPHQRDAVDSLGLRQHSPEAYFKYFRQKKVTTIVRLNSRTYEKQRFIDAGFQHFDLFFPDGSVPPDKILLRFLRICESTEGAVAVHCKAGLGRTGTLIACYLMKHYKFTAAEAMAWTRICRPGSVIGPQQHWLEEKQSWLWEQGEAKERKATESAPGKLLTNGRKLQRRLANENKPPTNGVPLPNPKHVTSNEVKHKGRRLTQGDYLNHIKVLRRLSRLEASRPTNLIVRLQEPPQMTSTRSSRCRSTSVERKSGRTKIRRSRSPRSRSAHPRAICKLIS